MSWDAVVVTCPKQSWVSSIREEVSIALNQVGMMTRRGMMNMNMLMLMLIQILNHQNIEIFIVDFDLMIIIFYVQQCLFADWRFC